MRCGRLNGLYEMKDETKRTISIIVPVYRVEKYLARCVDSILAQTFSDFELILVDDGSPDCCGEICNQYAKQDDRIVVIHKENGGLSDARNVGIEWAFQNSNSQWLFFVDSDDWIDLNSLEILYNAALKFGVRCVVGNFQRVSSNAVPTVNKWNASKERMWDALDLFLERKTEATTAWGKLYDKKLFETMRYPVGRLHEDEFLTYKVLYLAKKVVFVDMPLYQYFFNEEGIVNSRYNPKRMDAIDAFEEQRDFFQRIDRMDLAKEWDHLVLGECAKHYRALKNNNEKMLMKQLHHRADAQIAKMHRENNFFPVRDLLACESFRPLLATRTHVKIDTHRMISQSFLGKVYREVKETVIRLIR